MNERIATLANESGFDVDKTGTFGNYSEMHRLEKFAGLIVQDCIQQMTLWERIDLAIHGILEHFGVK